MRRPYHLFWCSALLALSGRPVFADGQQQVPQKLSSPFLIVDLDGKGITVTALGKSSVYTDVDGDGTAEHTAWIPANEAFLGILSRSEGQYLTSMMARFSAAYTGGLQKIEKFDKNKDGVYDEKDYPAFANQKFRDLGFYIVKDLDQDGLPDSSDKNNVKCNFKSLDYSVNESGAAEGIIHCADQSYRFKEVRFDYEDKHVPWATMCKKMEYEHTQKDDFSSKCIKNGYQPYTPSKNAKIWKIPQVNSNPNP